MLRDFEGHYLRSGTLVTNGGASQHWWVSEHCNARCIYHLETA
jgi:hypothetical protein